MLNKICKKCSRGNTLAAHPDAEYGVCSNCGACYSLSEWEKFLDCTVADWPLTIAELWTKYEERLDIDCPDNQISITELKDV